MQTLPVSTEETAASTAESESESVIVTTPEASTQETQPSLQPSEKETEAPSSSAETTPETMETVDPEMAKKEAEMSDTHRAEKGEIREKDRSDCRGYIGWKIRALGADTAYLV